eukprot:COSAG01_NODE_4330_length_5126_cov_21.673494_1_plen_65_part_00
MLPNAVWMPKQGSVWGQPDYPPASSVRTEGCADYKSDIWEKGTSDVGMHVVVLCIVLAMCGRYA